MPVVGKVITTSVFSQFLAQRFKGRDAINLADIIGTSAARYLIIPNKLTFFMSGIAGPVSSVTSLAVVGLAPPVMANLMMMKAASYRFTGRDIRGLFSAISMRMCTTLQTMLVNGSAMGIATGTGIGSFTGVNPIVLSKMISSQALFKKFTGRDCRKIADCIAFGISQHLISSVKVTATALGAPAPVPPVGPVPVIGIPTVYNKIF